MSAAPSLLSRWESSLVFRIGENDSTGLDQLPDFRSFPAAFPCAKPVAAQYAPCALGYVLAVALLKLYRPWPSMPNDAASLDPCGGWLFDVAEVSERLPVGYRRDVMNSLFMSLGTVIEMALLAPDRLPVLASRIDMLDNDTLRSMAIGAVSETTYGPDVFAGLYE